MAGEGPALLARQLETRFPGRKARIFPQLHEGLSPSTTRVNQAFSLYHHVSQGDEMARILLGGFDGPTATQLASLLRSGSHRIQICGELQLCVDVVRDHRTAVDLVIVDATSSPALIGECLRVLRCQNAGKGPKIRLLCVSRAYHGPRFEIDIEREGARLVYVR